jgi:(R,R)-butanediol dehydrogenase/meso-butanediol dehydrogenase/diacetyl reductase
MGARTSATGWVISAKPVQKDRAKLSGRLDPDGNTLAVCEELLSFVNSVGEMRQRYMRDEHMRAVRLHAVGDLRVDDIAVPRAPDVGEVSLRLAAAGICGSDLHNFRTGAWISRAPSVAGHEFTGTVTAVGHGVTNVVLGQRVVVDSRRICRVCENCHNGLDQICDRLGFLGEVIDGGFAEHVTMPARNALAAPDDVPDRHLAMAEPVAVALHALRRLAPPDGSDVVVTGCGPIGGLVSLLASRSGHKVKLIER